MTIEPHSPQGGSSGIDKPPHEIDQIFKLLVESVHDYSIFVIGLDGTIETWNAGAAKIKGYAADEIIGKPYGIFFTPEDRENGKPRHILQQARIRGAFHDEGWRVRKDGTRFWASATLTVLKDEQGVVRGYAKVTHDDTERHRTAESLRHSEERFRLAISALREHAFYMLDVNGIVQSWNAGAERHKGYTADEIIGQHFSVFFTDDDQVSGKPMRELAVAIKMGSFEEEGWRVRKDRSRFWAAVVITAIRDESGALRGFVKVTRDETAKHEAGIQLQQALERTRVAELSIRQHALELERRVEERTQLLSRQTEKLVRTNAELEQFAFIASHDLKEPLRMVTSFLDLLRERYADHLEARAKDYIGRAIAAADRMHEMVEAVLEYSRSFGGPESFEVVPIAGVIEDAASPHLAVLHSIGGTITVGDMPLVRGHRIHLIRVFQNLLANAIKYRSAAPPRIAITDESHEREWVFAVADNGRGIDPELHPRLFKLFQRLHAVDDCPGSGIGLATCKKIVEHHGGRIWVESQVGKGTVFRFTIAKELEDM